MLSLPLSLFASLSILSQQIMGQEDQIEPTLIITTTPVEIPCRHCSKSYGKFDSPMSNSVPVPTSPQVLPNTNMRRAGSQGFMENNPQLWSPQVQNGVPMSINVPPVKIMPSINGGLGKNSLALKPHLDSNYRYGSNQTPDNIPAPPQEYQERRETVSSSESSHPLGLPPTIPSQRPDSCLPCLSNSDSRSNIGPSEAQIFYGGCKKPDRAEENTMSMSSIDEDSLYSIRQCSNVENQQTITSLQNQSCVANPAQEAPCECSPSIHAQEAPCECSPSIHAQEAPCECSPSIHAQEVHCECSPSTASQDQCSSDNYCDYEAQYSPSDGAILNDYPYLQNTNAYFYNQPEFSNTCPVEQDCNSLRQRKRFLTY